MNLRDLEYLVALERFGHFGKAAHHCYVSQPTLSGQIKKLEEELEVTLLERKNKTFVFTDAGLEILKKAKSILVDVEHIKDLAASFKDPFSGVIKVAAIPTVGPFLWPLILSELKAEFKNLEFVLYELTTGQTLEKLRKGELDFGILALPVEGQDLHLQSLYPEEFSLMASKEEDGFSKNKLTLNSLQGSKVYLLEEGHCFRDQALEICKRFEANEERSWRATSLETLKHMVSLGGGVTLVPQLAVEYWKTHHENKELEYYSFHNPAPCREIGLVSRVASHRQECIARIGEKIKETVNGKLKLNQSRKKKEILSLKGY